MIGWPLFEQGPWGIAWLRPQSLLGIEVLSPVLRGAMLALAANVLILVDDLDAARRLAARQDGGRDIPAREHRRSQAWRRREAPASATCSR